VNRNAPTHTNLNGSKLGDHEHRDRNRAEDENSDQYDCEIG
jgi:hypothetical protein